MPEPIREFPFGCCKSGLFALAGLGAFVLTVAAALVWRSVWLVGLFAALFALLALALWLLFGNLQVDFRAGRVLIRHGTFFPMEITCPARSILAVSAFSTLLLRRLGCPVVLLTLNGRTVLLPAIPRAGYEALCALSGG